MKPGDTISIEITNTENEAFSCNCDGEVARILRGIADKIEAGGDFLPVRDINGNKVGEANVDESERSEPERIQVYHWGNIYDRQDDGSYVNEDNPADTYDSLSDLCDVYGNDWTDVS